ncbi:MAG: 30S ribosomal protein S12 [Alphaproteobacteria bacterium]|nr:MAG: 30S ribosomal protein S12 [Alphaproteobacteria bacterium]
MPTVQQLIRKANGGRKDGTGSKKSSVLGKSGQVRGVLTRVYTVSPRKPNSARRPVAKVKTSNGYEIIAHIPGEGHSLQEHSSVLVRGKGPPDLPGVRHRIIRGVLDAKGVQSRMTARSRYGTAKPKGK